MDRVHGLPHTHFDRDDPRSVAAMLRGVGDGRERACACFFDFARRAHPEYDEADHTGAYARLTFRLAVFWRRQLLDRPTLLRVRTYLIWTRLRSFFSGRQV